MEDDRGMKWEKSHWLNPLRSSEKKERSPASHTSRRGMKVLHTLGLGRPMLGVQELIPGTAVLGVEFRV